MHTESFSGQVSELVKERRHRLISLTLDLIRFKTEVLPGVSLEGQILPESELKSLNYLSNLFEDLDLSVEKWETKVGHKCLVGKWSGSAGGRSLLFNGHMDTVPLGEASAWTTNPWGEVRNERICGLGATDMKGGLASIVTALQMAKELGFKPKGDIIFEVVYDEECTAQGTRECVEKGFVADAGIFAEPTELAINPTEAGLVHFRIEVEGRSAHSGARYRSIHAGGKGEGVNAIEKAVKLIQAIRELENHWANTRIFPLFPPGSNHLNPGLIIGGPGGGRKGRLNKYLNPAFIPDYCSIEYELKFYPDEEYEQVRREFEDYVVKVCRADPWLSKHLPRFTWAVNNVYFPPVYTPLDHPFVETVERAWGSSTTLWRSKHFKRSATWPSTMTRKWQAFSSAQEA